LSGSATPRLATTPSTTKAEVTVTNPTDLPGASIAVMALPKAPLPSRFQMTRDNRDAVEVLIDRTGLPAPTVEAGAESVHVLLADIDDMQPWLAELDGCVRIGPSAEGLETWTLYTQLAATRRRGAVRIEVHALAVSGQFVLPSIRDAVAA
jgi:hypothetical protein